MNEKKPTLEYARLRRLKPKRSRRRDPVIQVMIVAVGFAILFALFAVGMIFGD